MAPPFKGGKANPNAWHENAYLNNDDIDVQHELVFEGDAIKPGTIVRFKNTRGTFKFRCLAHNRVLDTTWLDVIDCMTGEMRSFHLAKLKGPVKAKARRKRKVG